MIQLIYQKERPTENWDYIIVGTGPAGATLAREFSRKKKRVLILEKGKEDFSINIPKMLLNQEMMFIGQGRTLVRGIRAGGTSVLFYGTAYEPPLDFFLKYGIDLSAEIEELRLELPISPLRDELIGPGAKKIMHSALELGYPWVKLEKFIYQDKCTAATFPHEARWNAIEFIQEAVTSGAAFFSEADVVRILTTGHEAIGVEYRRNGEVHAAYGAKVILAAGGIGSAQILLNTGISGAGDGFFCDPLILVQGNVEGMQAADNIPMTAGMISEEGYILTDIALPKKVFQLFTAQAFRFNHLSQHHKSIGIMVKIKDEIGGQIRKNGKIKKNFSSLDKLRMKSGLNKAQKILKHAGAKGIYPTAWTSAHPGGSVRIGEVVDQHLKAEFDNLYVCDASVIPDEWGLPPTLTVMALAKRLAKYLLAGNSS